MLELIKKNRSYRRFDNSKKIGDDTIMELIECARLSQSATNAQPLRYLAINDDAGCEKVFPHLKWAGMLKDWDGPVEAERPVSYILVMSDSEAVRVNFAQVDSGLAMQNICLSAINKGIGSCMIGSFNKKRIGEAFDIPDRYEILWGIALGYPVENVVITECDGDVSYYRDEEGNHYVPKIPLKDVII